MIKFLQFCSILIPALIMMAVIAANLNCKHLTWQRALRDWILITVCILAFGLALSNASASKQTATEPESVQHDTEVESFLPSIDEVTETETSTTLEPDSILVLESETNTELETEIETEQGPVYKSLGIARITAYCSCKKCCGKWADRRPKDENGNPIVKGASGAVLIPEYSVAVDPKVIPYGTKIYIDGKEYIAHDCGGAIDGNDIDIYFDSHEKALKWGAKRKEIFILVEEEN